MSDRIVNKQTLENNSKFQQDCASAPLSANYQDAEHGQEKREAAVNCACKVRILLGARLHHNCNVLLSDELRA
jgi:hypothetical protein